MPSSLVDIDMKDLSSIIKNFDFQYSYNNHNHPVNSDYFSTSTDGLSVSLYKDDKPFNTKTDTAPRSELRGHEKILDNKDYVLSFDYFIKDYPGMQYCLCQIFGNGGPNFMYRFRSGRYQILSSFNNIPNLDLKYGAKDDLNQWVKFKLEFNLSKKGYFRFYRNDKLTGELKGNTSGGNDSYLKMGIYKQGTSEKQTGTMKVIFRNLLLKTT